MNNCPRTSSPRWPRNGLTLIEVLAALVILATLLTGLLLTKNRALKQQALAERRLQAVAAADLIMERMWTTNGLSASQAGDVPDRSEFRWRILANDSPDLADVSLRTMSLEILGRSDDTVLARVQWLAVRPSPTTQPASKWKGGKS